MQIVSHVPSDLGKQVGFGSENNSFRLVKLKSTPLFPHLIRVQSLGYDVHVEQDTLNL